MSTVTMCIFQHIIWHPSFIVWGTKFKLQFSPLIILRRPHQIAQQPQTNPKTKNLKSKHSCKELTVSAITWSSEGTYPWSPSLPPWPKKMKRPRSHFKCIKKLIIGRHTSTMQMIYNSLFSSLVSKMLISVSNFFFLNTLISQASHQYKYKDKGVNTARVKMISFWQDTMGILTNLKFVGITACCIVGTTN